MSETPVSIKFHSAVYLTVALGIVGTLSYAYASPTIRGHVLIEHMPVGGLTRAQAQQKVQSWAASRLENGTRLTIDGEPYQIQSADIDLDYDIDGAIADAWNTGRRLNPVESLAELAMLALVPMDISIPARLNIQKLQYEVDTIATSVDEPGLDVRLKIEGSDVTVLSDTKPGFLLDRPAAVQAVLKAIQSDKAETVSQSLTFMPPTVSTKEAPRAKQEAELILAEPLTMTSGHYSFTLTKTQIGDWIDSVPAGQKLDVRIDQQLLSQYVTNLATLLNADPQEPKITVVDGKVTEFTAPRSGRSLDQSQTVALITDTLEKRKTDDEPIVSISLPVVVKKPDVTDTSAQELGIVELIGTASTRFTGSPKNRISNIKNGVKFLTGIIVPKGEEFSTLQALGTVDNTSGYLPELVIKENRTVPEFGGGLCQVSTTLFRAALNTGLPITRRQNHSYRVIYYERDGEGNFIGPGLDATIYNPAPDFRFLNDTPAAILIQGSVEGDKITFNFYGTPDGRTAHVDGPHKLTETPAGDAIYVETDTLPPGETKRIETPHPGGTAIATYTVTYADGTEKKQEFKSFYRNWPAQYLVGIDPTKATSTPPLLPTR